MSIYGKGLPKELIDDYESVSASITRDALEFGTKLVRVTPSIYEEIKRLDTTQNRASRRAAKAINRKK